MTQRTPQVRGEEGSVAVEVAVVAPAFVFLMLLVVFAGRVSEADTTIRRATSEAARAASLRQHPSDAAADAETVAVENLSAAGMRCVTLAVEVDDTDFRPGGTVTVTVDCTASMDALALANEMFPTHPIVAVVGEIDAPNIMEALARGADGVIALKDPPEMWRECVHVVLGGGRWLGGPGLDVQLEDNSSSYDIATNQRHKGDITLRTKLFVRSRLADKTGQ